MSPHKKIIEILITLAVVVNFLWMLPTASAEVILATAPSPSSLSLENCDLFWSDASEAPIKKISVHGGEAIALAAKMGVPASIAIQGQYLFWVDERSGFSPSGCVGNGVTWILNKSSLDGTSKTELARGDHCRDRVADIVVDDTNVYWVNVITSPDTYTLKRVPIEGGPSTTMVTTEFAPIVALASDATYIYWAEDTFPTPDVPPSAIKRMPKSGGEIEVVASGLKSIRGGLALYGGEIFFADSNYVDTLRLMKASVSGGLVTTLATVTKGPSEPTNDVKAITADNENLYWLDKKAVNAVPVNGGSITTLASVSLYEPLDLALSAGQLFWTESTGPAHGETGTVKSVSTLGGAVTTLVQGGDAPRKLALDGNEIYWTEGGYIGLTEGFGRIAKIPAGGGMVTTVISGVMSDSPPVAVNGSYVYIADKWMIKKVSIVGGIVETLANADSGIEDLATDGSFVYFIRQPISDVFKVPVEGGTVTLFASGTGGGGPAAGPIRVLNGYVYWMDYFSIEKAPIEGGAVVTLVSSDLLLDDFVVDGTDVYFSETDTSLLRKVSVNGGPITTLAVLSPFWPRRLALDSQNLYWVDQIEVGKIPKDGGSLTRITSSVDSEPFFPPSIAVDHTGLYWTETATGEIVKYTFDEECIPTIKATKAMPWIPLLLLGD